MLSISGKNKIESEIPKCFKAYQFNKRVEIPLGLPKFLNKFKSFNKT
jgi:hypothetical protein